MKYYLQSLIWRKLSAKQEQLKISIVENKKMDKNKENENIYNDKKSS